MYVRSVTITQEDRILGHHRAQRIIVNNAQKLLGVVNKITRQEEAKGKEEEGREGEGEGED